MARASTRSCRTAKRPEDLGVWLGADLTAAEVRYLMAKEGAQTADDVLWRRSKLGLRFSQSERAALEQFMTAQLRPAIEPPPDSAVRRLTERSPRCR